MVSNSGSPVSSSSSSRAYTSRGQRPSSDQLAATGADSRQVLIGSLVAGFFVSAGAAATFWSRAGVRLSRRAKDSVA
ncbi:hypothetical protein ACFC14_18550 [Microbacterium sp. NPDC055988]|uniref:hypothetical protein n=1 Tax=Microbacterium sp. NPDC055988 TaxID=3345671 RepID=UPI0035DACBFC